MCRRLLCSSAARYGLKTFQRDIASGHTQDAYSLGDFFIVQMSGREDFFDAFFDGFELCIEQAGLNVCEQLLSSQQRIEFGCAKPESGKLKSLPVARCIVVSVALAVICYRCVEIQAHL